MIKVVKPAHSNKTTASSKVYDPIFNTEAASSNLLITAAVSDSIQYYQPKSPMSGRVMERVLVGTHGQVPFYAWCDIADRIVLPYKE